MGGVASHIPRNIPHPLAPTTIQTPTYPSFIYSFIHRPHAPDNQQTFLPHLPHPKSPFSATCQHAPPPPPAMHTFHHHDLSPTTSHNRIQRAYGSSARLIRNALLFILSFVLITCVLNLTFDPPAQTRLAAHARHVSEGSENDSSAAATTVRRHRPDGASPMASSAPLPTEHGLESASLLDKITSDGFLASTTLASYEVELCARTCRAMAGCGMFETCKRPRRMECEMGQCC